MKGSESKSKTTTVAICGLDTAAWLFTLGFCKLGSWASVAAIFGWPYYLGREIAAVIAR